MRRLSLSIPAAEFDDYGVWFDVACKLLCMGLQAPDFGICQIVVVQIGDLLKQLEASHYGITFIFNPRDTSHTRFRKEHHSRISHLKS